MKSGRCLRAALSGAALVLLPVTAQPASAPAATTQAAAHADDGGQPDRGGQPGPGGRPDTQPQPPVPGLCRPGVPPNAPPTIQFHENNPLLGPAELPAAPPVGPLLAGYRRFGALTRAEFLQQYGNPTQTGYVFPPASGFLIAPDGRPIKTAQTLLPGYRLDRFGFPGGQFLIPLGTPFSSRSQPPTNLNTPANAPLANYHTYCVLKSFTVDAGPIAPWFAQPGMGTQFKLEQKYLPQAGINLNVTWLLENGYLVEENLAAGPPPGEADAVPDAGGAGGGAVVETC